LAQVTEIHQIDTIRISVILFDQKSSHASLIIRLIYSNFYLNTDLRGSCSIVVASRVSTDYINSERYSPAVPAGHAEPEPSAFAGHAPAPVVPALERHKPGLVVSDRTPGQTIMSAHHSHNVAGLVPSVPAVEHSTVAALQLFWQVPRECSYIPEAAAFAVVASASAPEPIVAVAAAELVVEVVVAAEPGQLLKLVKLVLLLVAGGRAMRWTRRQCWGW
jgi:hypothetical protein